MEISVLNERPLRKKDRLGLALHVHLLCNRLRSDYRRALQRWFRFFPEISCYEDFMRDPVAFVNRVFTFLGLDALPASVLQRKSCSAHLGLAARRYAAPAALRLNAS